MIESDTTAWVNREVGRQRGALRFGQNFTLMLAYCGSVVVRAGTVQSDKTIKPSRS